MEEIQQESPNTNKYSQKIYLKAPGYLYETNQPDVSVDQVIFEIIKLSNFY